MTKEHRNYILYLLVLIVAAAILVNTTGCKCPEIATKTDTKDSSWSNKSDSIRIRKLELSLHFKTDSINRLDSTNIEITNQVEMLNAILTLCNDSGRTITPTDIQTVPKPKFKPYTKYNCGYGCCEWGMNNYGQAFHNWYKRDTILKPTVEVPDTTHYVNSGSSHIKTVTNTVYVKENTGFANFCIKFFWFICALVAGAGVGLFIRYKWFKK